MSNKYQEQTQLGLAIDLVSTHYNIRNPLIIMEKIEQDLDLNYTVFQIMDNLNIKNNEQTRKSRMS